GFPPLPRNPDAVSRPGEGFLYRLDAAVRPAGTIPGRHRHVRSLAIPQRAGAVTPHRHGQSGNARSWRFLAAVHSVRLDSGRKTTHGNPPPRNARLIQSRDPETSFLRGPMAVAAVS